MSHPLISNFQSVGGLLLKNLSLSTFGFLLFKFKVKILPQKLLQRLKRFSGGHLGLMTTNCHQFPLILCPLCFLSLWLLQMTCYRPVSASQDKRFKEIVSVLKKLRSQLKPYKISNY